MSSKWLTSSIVNKLVAITVVSTNEHLSIISLYSFIYLAYTFVYCFNSLNSSRNNTSMTYHIWISIVNNNKSILLRINSINELFSYFWSTHFWLEVVSSNLWRRYKYSVFAFVWFFNTTVKEECYVSILFSFCNSSLL